MISKKIIGSIVVGIIILLVFITFNPFPHIPIQKSLKNNATNGNIVNLIATNPTNLDGAVISPSQAISVTFNYPIDETYKKFQINLDPNIDTTMTLSSDKRTITLKPLTNFGFGQGYTLHISAENSFSGGKKLDHDIDLHFSTVTYSGV